MPGTWFLAPCSWFRTRSRTNHVVPRYQDQVLGTALLGEIMKKTFVVTLVVLVTVTGLAFLFSCGGGGGSESGMAEPAESLTGTFTLDYFYLGVYDCSGGIFGAFDPGMELLCLLELANCDTTACSWSPVEVQNSDNTPGISGTLVVTDNVMYEILTSPDGSSAIANTYAVDYTNPTTEGMLHYDDTEYGDPSFICAGNMLSLITTAEFTFITTTKFMMHQDWIKISDEAVVPVDD